MSKSLTTDIFISRSKDIHGETYDYLLSFYVNAKTPIDIICKEHNLFKQLPFEHFAGKGCKKCGNKRSGNKQRMTIDEFISRSHIIHNYKYNYSNAIYQNNSTKIEISCPYHGSFKQVPYDHLGGKGCKKCANDALSISLKMTKDDFIQKANEKHNNFYTYLFVEYVNSRTKVVISCPSHGMFRQCPGPHLQGAGCPGCAAIKISNSLRMTKDAFIMKANKVHNYRYDYSLSIYVNGKTKIEISCIEHGVFLQNPDGHLCGLGCPKCASTISKQEIKWLDSLNIPIQCRQKILYIGKCWIKADAYDPTTNAIYEFNGDFWHGNPLIYNPTDINPKNKKSYGELYMETQAKKQLILDAGYNLVDIWESEWKTTLKLKPVDI